ncbi:MAG: bifunctional folylpolyglutamate synthase/dihydrofolate synthase [Muribaculaceae bacterium]|nr:bifunctional folylpolyglutamate synthase/dihydrofolate synthase [Muribaculaceae bacterium]
MDTDFTSYSEALDWLFKQLPMFSRVGAAAYKPGLDTSLALDDFFGNPHRAFTSIHVAGTNGKGSVSHSLAAILQSSGLRVGLYTSPHLVDFRERIRVNGEMISRQGVIDFLNRYRASGYEGHPSFFELTMMMAFDWFKRQHVDIAVIETGMGGRLDSTNIITPIGCVITNISKDHTQFLGDTLTAIAGEKAGIIKQHIPVVIGEAEGDVHRVFEAKAAEMSAPVTFAADTRLLPDVIDLDSFTAHDGQTYSFELKGDYQKANVRTIFAAVEMLRSLGLPISAADVRAGLAGVSELTGLAGRWMRLAEKPLTIADTGHNQAGLTYNMQQLAKLMAPGKRLHIVLGFVNDKDVDHILPLFPQDAIYYVTQAQIPRAMPVETVAEKCAARGFILSAYPDVASAYAAAVKRAGSEDIIYIGGSTFIVADLLAALDNE